MGAESIVSTFDSMTEHPFPNVDDDLVERNAAWAAGFEGEGFVKEPTRRCAIVTCMDSRIDVFAMLGLGNGEAHIIRNAGGAVTDDVVRSLCLSQRFLGTKEIVLVHHTDCGLHNLNEHEFQHRDGTRHRYPGPAGRSSRFRDPYQDVRQSIRRVELSPYITYKEHVSGFVYDVASGELHAVE